MNPLDDSLDSTTLIDCESYILLELRGEYISFIIDLETELSILKHFLVCKRCRGYIKRFVEMKCKNEDKWSKLFSRNQPAMIIDNEKITQIKEGTQQKQERVEDNGSFIDERIKWRMTKIRNLIINAESELNDLNLHIQ